jgi:hypothetical protein
MDSCKASCSVWRSSDSRYRVVVRGSNVPDGPQDFALVITADYEASAACGTASEPSSLTPNDAAFPTPATVECADKEAHCASWSDRGMCSWERFSSYMAHFCAKSCSVCAKASSAPSRLQQCKNLETDSLCEHWRSFDYCSQKFSAFMGVYCRRSCSLCSSA